MAIKTVCGTGKLKWKSLRCMCSNLAVMIPRKFLQHLIRYMQFFHRMENHVMNSNTEVPWGVCSS